MDSLEITPVPRVRLSRFKVALVLLILGVLVAESLWAHGSMLVPASRIYECRFNDDPANPANPACAAAVAFTGDNQFLYDWDGILVGSAAGQHQAVVPDGELCSAGDAAYAGLDLPRSDWQTTVLEPDAQGNFEFVYRASVPHGTEDMLFFITREGWDPTQPLTWADLDFVDDPGDPNDPADPFCVLSSAALSDYPEDPTIPDQVYRMSCPLPERTGHHVIYHVWQVAGSGLAFYGCLDVEIRAAAIIFSDGFESGGISAWSP